MQASLPSLPSPLRTRIAPTPSGLLHEGNLLNFMLIDLIAKAGDGNIRLRIDDLDAPRIKDEFVQDIFDKIQQLGITIDSGPTDPKDQSENYSQAGRLHLYNAAVIELTDKGLLFACTCTRSEIREKDPSGRYIGTCADKGLPLDTSDSCLRLHTSDEMIRIPEWGREPIEVDLDRTMPFPVIRRKDGLPSYQIASLVDDLEHGVNFIVRGMDLLPSSAIQLHLAALLERPEFRKVAFFHHELEVDGRGEKLSKSNGTSGTEPKIQIDALRRKAKKIIDRFSV
jgi:glutamyl-tRNA synthetase